MLLLLLTLLAISHMAFQWSFWRDLIHRRIPDARGWLGLGLLLYYDLGIFIEFIGIPYEYKSFRSAIYPFDGNVAIMLVILIVSPWVIDLGWQLAKQVEPKNLAPHISAVKTRIVNSRIRIFVALALTVTLICDLVAFYFLSQSQSLWGARDVIGETLGPAIIFLRLPMAFLVLWLMQWQSRSIWGWMLTILLTLGSMITTLPIGQRTATLLPILIVMLFGFRPNLPRFAFGGGVLIVVASLVLPLFKWQFSDSSSSQNLIIHTVYSDLHRANVLVTTVEQIQKSSSILPYNGAGYVYSALIFLPRNIIPFDKGYSTSQTYTTWREGRRPSEGTWSLALGSLDETLLNFGFIGLLLLFPAGIMVRFLDNIAKTHISLTIPIYLAMVWLWGYDTSVVIQLFGGTAIFVTILHWIFVSNARVSKNDGAIRLVWTKKTA